MPRKSFRFDLSYRYVDQSRKRRPLLPNDSLIQERDRSGRIADLEVVVGCSDSGRVKAKHDRLSHRAVAVSCAGTSADGAAWEVP